MSDTKQQLALAPIYKQIALTSPPHCRNEAWRDLEKIIDMSSITETEAGEELRDMIVALASSKRYTHAD